MSNIKVIGIDPGKSGGIALINNSTVTLMNMPENVNELDLWFDKYHEDAYIILEQVHASPQMGVSSAFTFGRGFGQIEGILMGLPLKGHFEYVTPQKWQTALGCRTGGDKKISLAKAKNLFPDAPGITLKTADALLLAYYGYTKYVRE